MTRKIFWGLCLIGLISIMTMSINVCADDSKTSAEKINEDLNNGILDDETALKYKLLAIYNQSEAPEKYRSNKKMLS